MADVDFLRPREYRDVSLSFRANPVTRDVIAVTGDEAVKRAIKNILSTVAGEVPFFPNFGSRLSYLLFEPIDPITTSLIETELRTTITTYEPRVQIQSLTVIPSEDENRYDITLILLLVNIADPVTLTLSLTRLR